MRDFVSCKTLVYLACNRGGCHLGQWSGLGVAEPSWSPPIEKDVRKEVPVKGTESSFNVEVNRARG